MNGCRDNVRVGMRCHPMRLPSVFSLLLLGILTGCGIQQYDERINAADAYYAFLGRQNEVLDSLWHDPETGIEIRPPKKLQLLSPPAIPADGSPGPAHDPRQPNYLDVQLPGLVGAWQGTVSADIGGVQQSVPAYFYVMSNIHLLQQPGMKDSAGNFFDEVLNALCQGLKIQKPDKERWEIKNYPSQGTYAAQKSIESTLLEPSEPINNVRTDFYLYEHANGDVQVSLLFVVPEGMNRTEMLDRARTISLETLSVPAAVPAPVASTGEGAAAPARSSGGF